MPPSDLPLFSLLHLSWKTRAILKATGANGSNAAVPTSVQEIVAARIDALDATVGLVLKVKLTGKGIKENLILDEITT